MKFHILDLREGESSMEVLHKECLSCRRCYIGGRTLDNKEWNPGDEAPLGNVFSTKNFDANVMVVGQNPGAEEVVKGIPFVGPSGKIFDKALLEYVGIERKDVYYTNVVKCLTPGNRKPTQSEIDNCHDFLDLEIKIVKPKVIVALGSHAFKALTGMSGIMKHSGTIVMSPRYFIPILVMLHPSPLNTNNPERNLMFIEAMKTLKEVMSNG